MPTAKSGRKMPAWKPAPAALVERFHHAIAAATGADVRNMFSYPAAFIGGNMFAGLFEASCFVRLGEQDRAALWELPGAGPFEPMPGRPMREYVVLPESVVASLPALKRWLVKSRDYAATLPAKKKPSRDGSRRRPKR